MPVDPSGVNGPTRGQARGSRWRSSSYGLYVPASVDQDLPEQRIVEQAARLAGGGAVTGWAACRLHGAAFFDGLEPDGRTRIPVPLCVGPRNQLAESAACTVSREQLTDHEIVVRHGIPCTRPQRALFDEMRRCPEGREAVVAMDMMAAAELVSIEQMRAYVAMRPGWKNVQQVRQALSLASEYSRSPNETRMRLIWRLDAGLPAPRVNQPIFDMRGRLLGIADLLDPVAGVVGEYDGADHRSAARHSSDVDREDRFRRHVLEVFRVTGPDLPDVPLVVSRMRSARSRARWLPQGKAPWTTTPPAHWEFQPCLDELLEMRRVKAEMYDEQARLAGEM